MEERESVVMLVMVWAGTVLSAILIKQYEMAAFF